MERTKQAILKALRKHRRLTRRELSTIVGVSDRSIRAGIEELRNEGHMIGITSSGGYSINNKTDFRRALALMTAQTRKGEKTIRRMKKTLENEGQLRLSL